MEGDSRDSTLEGRASSCPVWKK